MRETILTLLALSCLLAIVVQASSLHSAAPQLPTADNGRLLDDFHDAAAKADLDRYFGHFTADAVFLGTDPTERWTKQEFRAWAAPYFQGDSAWVYHAVERHVQLAPGGKAGWFDEVVRNDKYGDLRGTGVVLLEDGRWKLAQYNLTFLIPNDDAAKVLEIIKQ